MGTLYEKSDTPGGYAIDSENVLCCKETGRVIAVFYNDYDLEDFIEQNETLKDHIARIAEAQKNNDWQLMGISIREAAEDIDA